MRSAPEALVVSLDHLRGGARLVRLRGDVHERAGIELMALIDVQRSRSMDLLVLDLAELTTFGAMAVQIMVQIATELGRVDIRLCLVASDGLAVKVESALDVAGVRSLFELHISVDDALEVPRIGRSIRFQPGIEP
jgi:anti-anti-sigma regulatory factor